MTLTAQSAPSSLLSESSHAVVATTASVVAEHADEITARFYPQHVRRTPRVAASVQPGQPSHRRTGQGARELGGRVCRAADRPEPAVVRPRHAADRLQAHLTGRPIHQYTIVGHHLLEAVAQILGEAVTPDIAAAWEEVYWLFALQLVAEEARLYQHAGVDPAQPTRPYRIVKTIDETSDIISLVLEPADDLPLPEIRPGSTSRCSSTCPTVTVSRGSTRSPRLRSVRDSRSPSGGCLAGTAHPTVGCPLIYTTKRRWATFWTSARLPEISC